MTLDRGGQADGASLVAQPGAELWRHPAPKETQMWTFMTEVNRKHDLSLETYQDLYKWSISNTSEFWAATWDFVRMVYSEPYNQVISDASTIYPRPAFFPNARLNFAQNLLFSPASTESTFDPTRPAILAATEYTREVISWSDLRERVRQCQAALAHAGVTAGDRVAGFVGNHVNALVSLLAATSLGAIWTAVSPDTGVTAVLDRLRQIEPVILLCDNAVIYNGRPHPTLTKVEEIAAQLDSLQRIIIFATVPTLDITVENAALAHRIITYKQLLLDSDAAATRQMTFVQLPADHPVYILYSSGTTGAPKCIVHGAIGTLLQHKKEHKLHCDIKAGDRLFYYTTTTWMMHHWLVGALASAATLVLYDGSPFRYASSDSKSSEPDDLAMPRLIDELKITHFGTSAKYLSVLEGKNIYPRRNGIHLNTLKAIYSTGSPLAPSTFFYVYAAFGPDINLGSITGGTDIISLFGAPCPLTPVFCGEIQVAGLGMAIAAWTHDGGDVTSTGEAGELVCTKPFVCQPVAFWGADGAAKYKSSYFDAFPGVWAHGDFVRFNPATGGLYMLGRSDGVLKPGGVRFGSAEIYNILLAHFVDEVEDALCVGRRREGRDADETVVLFLKMRQGRAFGPDLAGRIKAVIRTELSARHVPGIIDQCFDIPLTTNGKKVEGAVKQILCGMNVKTSASVANAECLDWYRDWARKHDA